MLTVELELSRRYIRNSNSPTPVSRVIERLSVQTLKFKVVEIQSLNIFQNEK